MALMAVMTEMTIMAVISIMDEVAAVTAIVSKVVIDTISRLCLLTAVAVKLNKFVKEFF